MHMITDLDDIVIEAGMIVGVTGTRLNAGPAKARTPMPEHTLYVVTKYDQRTDIANIVGLGKGHAGYWRLPRKHLTLLDLDGTDISALIRASWA